MNRYICNPYLPLYEYIPDGEPRVFDGRLYIYGSHDKSGGNFFCMEDYVVWSAPVDDLTDWRYEGVSYRKDQDPENRDGKWELFAPDVVKGPDGRYYLFYCLRMQQRFGVAVSESPAGPFEYYGTIRHSDGRILQEYMPYDPAVLVDEDGRVYLYYGYTSEAISARFGATVSPGCMVAELMEDMLTVKTEPKICLPKDAHTAGTGFEGHGYYEAPSIRKIKGKYYLVYSSEVCHELCYAVSDNPMEGFSYKGVIISNGDIGMNGRKYPVCLIGNNHGGLIEVRGQYYIFYQRHTRCTQFSRQGCAEPVELKEDGTICQVEVTTSGLQGGPLPAEGVWSGAYACHLSHRDGEKMLLYRQIDPKVVPAIWEDDLEKSHEERIQYIKNITDGTEIGYKYFQAEHVAGLSLTLRGKGKGVFAVYLDRPGTGSLLMELPVEIDTDLWSKWEGECLWDGVNALYLVYYGTGSLDLKEIAFLKD